MNNRGFTLTESLLALAIMGIALVGVIPTFLTYSDTNEMNEDRSGAIAAAQQSLETMRAGDPGSMPTTGASAVNLITVGARDYEVVVRYCTISSFCSADSRHVLVEVSYGGHKIYTVESVYTRLL